MNHPLLATGARQLTRARPRVYAYGMRVTTSIRATFLSEYGHVFPAAVPAARASIQSICELEAQLSTATA